MEKKSIVNKISCCGRIPIHKKTPVRKYSKFTCALIITKKKYAYSKIMIYCTDNTFVSLSVIIVSVFE